MEESSLVKFSSGKQRIVSLFRPLCATDDVQENKSSSVCCWFLFVNFRHKT